MIASFINELCIIIFTLLVQIAVTMQLIGSSLLHTLRAIYRTTSATTTNSSLFGVKLDIIVVIVIILIIDINFMSWQAVFASCISS